MNARLKRQLHLLAGGLLDPGEATRLREKIAADPALVLAFAELERAPSPPWEPSRAWRLPPPGLYGGPVGFGARVEAALSMGAEPLLRLRFQPPDLNPRAVVLLTRGARGWEVLSPERDEAPLLLADLPVVPETNERELLLTGVDPGPRGLVLALPALELLPTPPWGEDPWAPLRAALVEDRVPVRAVRALEVSR
jgi:hypothetical protein